VLRRLPPRLVLRLDAICDAALALFLLSSTWDALFEFLGLPVPKPAFYGQLLGAALVGLAILEWLVAGRPGEREVARGVAAGSALAATLIVVWLVSGRLDTDGHGDILLWLVAAFLALEGDSTLATAGGVPRRSIDGIGGVDAWKAAGLPLSDEP
jgi:hypothetical protein